MEVEVEEHEDKGAGVEEEWSRKQRRGEQEVGTGGAGTGGCAQAGAEAGGQ